MTSVRAVRAGDPYAPPPLPPGVPPDASLDPGTWQEAVRMVGVKLTEQRGREALVTECLVRGWQGVSPSLAKVS